METPDVQLIVLLGYVSSPYEEFPFNQYTEPFTIPTPGYRLLG